MKCLRLLITLTITIAISACTDNYVKKDIRLSDQGPRNSRDIPPPIPGDPTSPGTHTTNSNSLSENMQEFLDSYLVLKEGSDVDTLVDYDKLYEERLLKEVAELRNNLYTQIALTKYEMLSKNEKISFLINTYNFFAIEMVINNYFINGTKLNSITKIGADFSAFGQRIYNVAGELKSLDDIEKKTLKPLLTFEGTKLVDARFHFAVICAARGCPILMQEAYSAENIDTQLSRATIEGLKQKRNLEITTDTVRVTELFNWYKADFTNHSIDGLTSAGSVKNFIQQYTDNLNLDQKLKSITYDWTLNRI